MKLLFLYRYNYLKFTIILATGFILSIPSSLAQPFGLYGVSDLERIFEDGYNRPTFSNSINIFGIRNEILSGQFVIHATNDITDVIVEPEYLSDLSTGCIISSDVIEWNFVGNVHVTLNSPNQPARMITRKAPANFPEYLMLENKLDITKGNYRAVWLTIEIPVNACPGKYTGKVTVKSSQGTQSIPIHINIYPLTLPEKRNLKVTEWYTTNHFSRIHGINDQYSDEWFSMLTKYAENMVAHRQNVFQVPASSIIIRKTETGLFEFDFTRFDQIAYVFWDTGKMDFLETGELFNFGERSWADSKIVPKNFIVNDNKTGEQITIAGKEILPHLLPSLERHLRRKGWLDKTLFHIKDEPAMHNAISWLEASRYVKQHAPDLIRIDAIETTYVLGEIDIAVPKLDALASWYDSFKRVREKNAELWFYTVGIYQGSLLPNKTIDMPLIDTRLIHWMNYKYDATGYLHWGWNYWNENPYKDTGLHVGDGWHVYPVEDGILNSIRWEQMRNGIQDYEYFMMLENRIRALKDSLGTRFSWIDPKFMGKEIIREVIHDFYERSSDPAVLYSARKKILDQLLDFERFPQLYIQTDPVTNSVVTEHSSVAVYGWVEPGTNIVMNGKEIEVSPDGLFLQQLGGDYIDDRKIPLGDRIIIQALSDKGEKEVMREFIIK